MRLLVIFSCFILLTSCSKFTQHLDGTYEGIVFIEKNITKIGLIITANDTLIDQSERELKIEQLVVKGNKYELGELTGKISYDTDSIRFILKKHNCPTEANCFFPLVHGNMKYSFDGENLKIGTQRNYKEEFTNIGLEGYIKYDYSLVNTD